MMGSERFDWIDSWRGMLILLVVFWHALGARLEVSSADVHSSQWLHGFISNFHMVAFFAISGFVWNSGRESLWRYAKKNFGRLMVPYYCFAGLGLLVLSVMVLAGMGGGYETIFSSAKEILFAGRPSCYSPVWFLSSLFAILMVCWALAPVLRNMAVLGGG